MYWRKVVFNPIESFRHYVLVFAYNGAVFITSLGWDSVQFFIRYYFIVIASHWRLHALFALKLRSFSNPWTFIGFTNSILSFTTPEYVVTILRPKFIVFSTIVFKTRNIFCSNDSITSTNIPAYLLQWVASSASSMFPRSINATTRRSFSSHPSSSSTPSIKHFRFLRLPLRRF